MDATSRLSISIENAMPDANILQVFAESGVKSIGTTTAEKVMKTNNTSGYMNEQE